MQRRRRRKGWRLKHASVQLCVNVLASGKNKWLWEILAQEGPQKSQIDVKWLGGSITKAVDDLWGNEVGFHPHEAKILLQEVRAEAHSTFQTEWQWNNMIRGGMIVKGVKHVHCKLQRLRFESSQGHLLHITLLSSHSPRFHGLFPYDGLT